MNSKNPYESPQATSPAVKPEHSKFAACPNCRVRNAKQISWTLWGGVVGPRMFNHVQCLSCRTTFNGKTGKSNNTAIAIYVGVSLLIGIAIFVGVLMANQM